jgi:hypothetical protein
VNADFGIMVPVVRRRIFSRGILVALVLGAVTCAAAMAARPIDGAMYLVGYSGNSAGNDLVDQTMTVASNGKSFSTYALYGRDTCSNGRRGLFEDSDTRSSPGPKITIKTNGTFTSTGHAKGSEYGTAGTFTAMLNGHFPKKTLVDVNLVISFKATTGSLHCTTGTVKISAYRTH